MTGPGAQPRQSASPASAVDAVDAAILAGLAGARHGALHFPAYFSGLTFDTVGEGSCTVGLAARPQVLDAGGDFSAMAIALMCDLGLGAAIRARIGKRPALPTVSLVIDYTTFPVRTDRLACRAAFVDRIGDLVTAQCELTTADGVTAGRARGRFLVQPRPGSAGFARYPWQRDPVDQPAVAELTEPERRLRAFLLEGLHGGEGPAPSGLHERLYRIGPGPRGRPGTASLHQPIGAHLANRTGNVQGGVIAGLLSDACRAAARTADQPLTRLVALSCTFMRPGRLDRRSITARAETQFGGRRLTCVVAEATDDAGTRLARAEAVLAPAAEQGQR